MKKEIELFSRNNFYGIWSTSNHCFYTVLCKDALQKYYNIPEDQQKIFAIFSSVRISQSYKLEFEDYRIRIEGKWLEDSYQYLDGILREFPKNTAYLRIELP